MFQRALPAVATLLALTLVSPWAARSEEEQRRGTAPLVEIESVTLELDGRVGAIAVHQTGAGPLVALEPIAAELGGELTVGPLGRSHELLLGERTFRFGPESPALTSGEEIYELSQPAAASEAGILVPIDLLRDIYTDLLGWDFSWNPAERRLVVGRRPPRDIPVVIDLVHLQGVSTLVFQFPLQPRYRVERSGNEIEVALVGDFLRSEGRRALPPDPLVKAVELGRQAIRIRLSETAVAADYVLQNPFRLVFDIHRGTTAPPPSIALTPSPQRRRQGIHSIVIDPGHGGADTGAEGPAGTLEKDLTLILARSLRSRLGMRLPVKVVLTRDEDAELPLDTRTAIGNQQKADLFVSLHINSSLDSTAHGAETYFSSLEATDERAARAAAAENLVGGTPAAGDPLYDLQLILWDLAQSHHMAESQRLASLIQEELNLALSLRNRGVKQAPFTVLMGAAMPAVLVELGFLSNPGEEERLQDPEYRDQLVDSLVRAIARYKTLVETGERPAIEALP